MDENSPLNILAYLTGASVLNYTLRHFWRNRLPREAVRVGTVSQVTLFPVKSMGGIVVPQAQCTFSGLQVGDIRDRAWIVAYGDENRFVTARQEPVLTTIASSLHGDYLHLDAKGHSTLTLPVHVKLTKNTTVHTFRVWGMNVTGVDCGREASDWISAVLGNKPGHKIIHHITGLPLRLTSEKVFRRSYYGLAKPGDKVAYHDSAPFTLGTDVSLANLNVRLKEEIPACQLRHTIEVTSLCQAFDEDIWKQFFIGSARFTSIGPIDRCLLTTVSPRTGTLHPEREPLTTLKTFRCVYPELGQDPAFGRLLVLDRPGKIHIGDPVFVVREPH